MRPILALLLITLAGCAQAEPVYDRVHGATLHLQNGRRECSATAITQTVILTASHCFERASAPLHSPVMPRQLRLNGETCEVWKGVDDGNDHVLIKVTGCKFANTAKIGNPAKVGDKVFVWGNPMDFKDLLRFGSFAGWTKGTIAPLGEVKVQLFQLPITNGDSGAAIFNERGQVVAMVSIGTRPYEMAGAFPFEFNRLDYKAVGLQ